MSAEGVPGIILIYPEKFETSEVCMKRIDNPALHAWGTEDAMNNKFEKLPQQLIDCIVEQLKIDGVVKVTKRNILDMISKAFCDTTGPIADMRTTIQNMSSKQDEFFDRLRTGDVTITDSQTERRNAFSLLRPDFVPGRIIFPSYDVKTMWDLW
eukprot:CAMPEP_0185022464 /NCGR_PEP_ID=MMETSP1103-20130426/5172_1 /TAXON_ID=36769 /ORGANISM="Paraphysomonas bandaiensis, Strain Caron Lab Isolate" /LENGTH=153 /DNA_ID=CAMNT_0027554535 /DNA_START=309 /DNA_END=768 /DNA_ORIENTATION=+